MITFTNDVKKKRIDNDVNNELKEYARKLRTKIDVKESPYRVLRIAEHVLRKVETDMFISAHAGKNEGFRIMSEVCDRYCGWLNDDLLIWEFVDGSNIGWNVKAQCPYIP